MNVVIIGTGNVANVLGRKIKDAGHTILQVIGRNAEKAYLLADVLNCASNNYLSTLRPDADIYIIAVSDNAIADIAAQLFINETGVLVHTAGVVHKEVLARAAGSYGVLYPLQSLSAQKKELPEIPFLIDGNTPETIQIIRKFALTLSDQVQYADDEMRQKAHVAAVISNNFSNYLFAISSEFCQKENVDFKLLIPLISETVNRLHDENPALLQTGPAVRRDYDTIEKHLSILKTYPDLQKLYKELSNYVIDYYSKR